MEKIPLALILAAALIENLLKSQKKKSRLKNMKGGGEIIRSLLCHLQGRMLNGALG